ncbi:MAG TPA: alginate lyase family protein [Tepidisphaeraceae bacterium]|jgi:hypothetical protein
MAYRNAAGSSRFQFQMQTLEKRTLMSIAPALYSDLRAPLAADWVQMQAQALSQPTVASLLTKAVRQDLLNHWSGSNKSSLQSLLNANNLSGFDAALLTYMQNRAGQTFYWNSADVAGNVSWIQTNLNTAGTIANADAILAHKFPEQGNSASYDIQLPAGVIDWSTKPATTSNPEFIPNLNRMDFWLDLTQAYKFTNSAGYMTELVNQLASWSQQNPALADPNSYTSNTPHWNLLDTSIRAESWTWAYQMILNSGAWTADANTLFLYQLYQHGDFLRRVTPYDAASNRAIFHAKGLLSIAQLVPEFTGASDWETYSRAMLFKGMDAQFYNDGGHVEQSPGYTANIADDLLESYWLDQKKNDAAAWSSARVSKLNSIMNSYLQILDPNGAVPALSDSYRNTALTGLLKARIALNNTTAYPAAKPRMRDVWLFGSTTAQTYLGSPVNPALPDRGKTYAMADAGYYIARSAGADANARQLTFDIGPTGGIHGHPDLLNFELFGYGRALIADPGLYTYDSKDPNRQYVVSTRAHNTINVDGLSHAALEGATNPGFKVDQWDVQSDHVQVTGHHFAYGAVDGGPVLTRSIWYDLDGTALVVDWAEASKSHQYQISFNLPVDPNDPASVTGVQSDNSFRSKWSTGGNVQVSPMLLTGQTVARNALTFVSNAAPPSESDPAYRFTVTGSGAGQVFATLVNAYSGTSAPNITASLVTTNPQPGQPVTIHLDYHNGIAKDITFNPPAFFRPGATFGSPTGSANDIAWDAAGRLHMAYFDRTARNLKYAVRDTAGKWSIPQTVDAGLDAGAYISLALDSKGVPGIAYFDGNNGDLKYARLTSGAWKTETVDSLGSVGLYPSLVFSRSDGPMISYFHRTKGDLRLAVANSGGWTISTVDAAGTVGRSGMMTLDPNRPTVSKVAICYEDTSGGRYKYAVQYKTGWKIQTVDSTTPIGGGYMSMAFNPAKDPAGVYQPSISYYDAYNSGLKYAITDGLTWSATTVAALGKQGLYTNLFYDASGLANILYFDKSKNHVIRAKGTFKKWAFTDYGAGGREMQVAETTTGALAYSNLNEAGPSLTVSYLKG